MLMREILRSQENNSTRLESSIVTGHFKGILNQHNLLPFFRRTPMCCVWSRRSCFCWHKTVFNYTRKRF